MRSSSVFVRSDESGLGETQKDRVPKEGSCYPAGYVLLPREERNVKMRVIGGVSLIFAIACRERLRDRGKYQEM